MICEKDLAYEMSIAMGHAALLKGSETRIFNLPSESVKDFAEYTAKKCSRTTQKTRLSSAEAAELTSGSCADIQEEKRLDSNLESLVDKRSFNAIRGRMEAYDKLRERLLFIRIALIDICFISASSKTVETCRNFPSRC